MFSSKKDHDSKNWFYIVSGKIKVSLDTSTSFGDETSTESFEIGPGEYFGGFGLIKRDGQWPHMVFDTLEATKLLELQGDGLELFLRRFETNGRRLLSMMGGMCECCLECQKSLSAVARDSPRIYDEMQSRFEICT